MSYTGEVEALRIEMTTGFATLTGKIDGYIAAHASQHAGEQQAFFQHKLDLAPTLAQLVGPPSMESRMRAQEDSALATATIIRTLKTMLILVTGGSLISALGSVVMLWQALRQ